MQTLINPTRMFTVVVLAIVGALSVGCAPSAQSIPTATPVPVEQVTLTMSGSGSVSSLMSAVEADFEADTPGYDLNILSGSGTSGAIKGVLEGTLDVAAMARAPKEEETAGGLLYINFANTGVAILAHPEVEVDNLTQEQVQAIFFGETTNWSAVGGPDAPIAVFVRDEDESATQQLRAVLFGDTPFPDTVNSVLTSTGDMIVAVSGTPASIGFANWIGVVGNEDKVKAVTVDEIVPTDTDYPVILPLGIGYAESHQETVQPLVDWLTSERGRTALVEHGAILDPGVG